MQDHTAGVAVGEVVDQSRVTLHYNKGELVFEAKAGKILDRISIQFTLRGTQFTV